MLNESELFGDIDEYILNKVKEQNGFALFSGKEIADELPMEKSNLINLFNGVLNDIRLYVIILTKQNYQEMKNKFVDDITAQYDDLTNNYIDLYSDTFLKNVNYFISRNLRGSFFKVHRDKDIFVIFLNSSYINTTTINHEFVHVINKLQTQNKNRQISHDDRELLDQVMLSNHKKFFDNLSQDTDLQHFLCLDSFRDEVGEEQYLEFINRIKNYILRRDEAYSWVLVNAVSFFNKYALNINENARDFRINLMDSLEELVYKYKTGDHSETIKFSFDHKLFKHSIYFYCIIIVICQLFGQDATNPNLGKDGNNWFEMVRNPYSYFN